ncbi:hypothetical protein N7519_004473 [Penicillium mononematosum]|uniref:uncharacterized protein n=1 Tax=Penicillium mononematosum TaxID=268346 RepID=UPI0025491D40|nr:uncharacterized protein N7519_004473 [Penicillium mononematosum]KAJ6189565.1 hypothetical protein N7519_004473 [Penicillium mononematosum]
MCPDVDVIVQIEYSQSVLVKGTSGQESGRVEEDKDKDKDKDKDTDTDKDTVEVQKSWHQ